MKSDYLMLRQKKLNCAVHINQELEVVYVEDGVVFVRDETGTVPVHAGEAILILPYRLHGFSCEEDVKATVFMFSYSIAEEFHNAYKMQSVRNQKFLIRKPLAEFLSYSLGLLSEQENGCTEKSIFYAIVAAYLQENALKEGKRHSAISHQEVVEYIFFHLSEELTLQQTAAALGINKNFLSGIFRDTVGISFGEFVKNVRIERAKSLLQKQDLTVTEIAYECGFGCVRSFNRAFLKCMGCTPTEYRKK